MKRVAIGRRRALQLGCGALLVGRLPRGRAAPVDATQPSTGLGLVTYCCRFRAQWLRRQDPDFNLFDPPRFLAHCRQLGAGGMQIGLGVLSPRESRDLRRAAEENGAFIDAIVGLPEGPDELEQFEAELRTAAAVGVQAARAVIMPGRRYERFTSLAEFREYEQRGQRMLERAAPVAEKHRLRLAIENHKDQRLEERVALLGRIGSEYVGACLDTGNSFALLDDPYEVVRELAPYAFSVHLKDQALQEYPEGFLLGDIPLGRGSFDLKRMMRLLRAAQPDVRVSLELITRDPLRVPCLRPEYWATMPRLPASDLARTLRYVREHRVEELQRVSGLPLEEQLALEDANVAASLRYAAAELRL